MRHGTRERDDTTTVRSVLRLLSKVVPFRDDELRPMLWATAYGFCIFLAYYILRPVRDEISSADRGNLQIIWTAVFLAMLVAVPLYSWIVSRYPRGTFVPLANRFFIFNLIVFYAALLLLPEGARAWIDRGFYVWAAVFALFVPSVFWGFMADVFRNDQGKRLFGFIAVGASLGGIGGSLTTSLLAQTLPPFTLLLFACIPLEMASWCAGILHRRYGGKAAMTGVADRPISGTALSGIRVVFQSPYLMRIAVYLGLMTFASTVLYFQQADLIANAFGDDRPARTAFYANIDLAVNIITIFFQTALVAHLIKKIGVGLSLAIVPTAACLGFVTLGVYPLLAVFVALQVMYRSGRYGIAKPAREVLFTVVGREEKYKSKAFLDAAVYRGGDLVSGWIYAGLAAVGLSIGAIALVAAPLAAFWAFVGFDLGQRQDELSDGKTAAPEEAVAVG